MRVALFALLLVCVGCPGEEGPPPRSKKPLRVVSLLPSFTEVLISIGCRETLVGVTSFAPPGADGIREIGGLVNPDLEAIFSLEPDLVVGMRSHTMSEIEKKLSGAGVPTLFLPNETLADAIAAIGTLGERMGESGAAEGLRKRIEEEMGEVRRRVERAPRIKAAVVVQHDPLMLAGRGSFLGELLEQAGGENIARDSKAPHPLFSLESFIHRAPEVIIDVSESYEGGADAESVIRSWDRLPETPARKSGGIHPLDPGLPIDPGPRVPRLFRFIASKIHPDRF